MSWYEDNINMTVDAALLVAAEKGDEATTAALSSLAATYGVETVTYTAPTMDNEDGAYTIIGGADDAVFKLHGKVNGYDEPWTATDAYEVNETLTEASRTGINMEEVLSEAESYVGDIIDAAEQEELSEHEREIMVALNRIDPETLDEHYNARDEE